VQALGLLVPDDQADIALLGPVATARAAASKAIFSFGSPIVSFIKIPLINLL